MICLRNLTYTYPHSARSREQVSSSRLSAALHHVTLDIPDKSMVALLGENGSGKSTLLTLLAGIIQPSSGECLIPKPLQDATGYLSQHAQFDLGIPLTVFEVAAMGLWRERGAFSAITLADRAAIQRILHRVGLQESMDKLLQELSGGQLQRLRFARLLLEKARLLLLDEPFNAVDEKTQIDLIDILQEQHQLGCTIIAALHDKSLAYQYFSHQILLSNHFVSLLPIHSSIVDSEQFHSQTICSLTSKQQLQIS